MSQYTDVELSYIFRSTTRPAGRPGGILPNLDLAIDELGNTISFSAYGSVSSRYGWEVDHRNALALGGSNDLANLRALAVKTNRRLGGLLSGRR